MRAIYRRTLPLLARRVAHSAHGLCPLCVWPAEHSAPPNGRADGLSPQTQSGAKTLASFCLVRAMHPKHPDQQRCVLGSVFCGPDHAPTITPTSLTSKHRISMEIASLWRHRKRPEQPTAANVQVRRNPGFRHSCRPPRRIRRHVARSLPGNMLEFHPTPSGS